MFYFIFFHLKTFSLWWILLEWGIEAGCADSVNLGKPQIKAPNRRILLLHVERERERKGFSDPPEAGLTQSSSNQRSQRHLHESLSCRREGFYSRGRASMFSNTLKFVGRSTILVSQQLLYGSIRIPTFMVPRGWVLVTLWIPWLFIWRHLEVDACIFVKYLSDRMVRDFVHAVVVHRGSTGVFGGFIASTLICVFYKM